MEEVPTIDDINNVVMTTRNNITLSTLQALTGSHEIPILSLKLVSSSLNSKLEYCDKCCMEFASKSDFKEHSSLHLM